MHFDTTLPLGYLLCLTLCFCKYVDEQSYLSFVEFHRGGPLSNVILSSPHGGFLGANSTGNRRDKSSLVSPLSPLPIGGCYNNTLDRCVYTFQDCLRWDSSEGDKTSFHPDARCIIDRSSTSAMYSLTKAISEVFSLEYRPFMILNKLTRQYVDPAEDLLAGTFLLESATRLYMDYHRLIAMAKEAIRPPSRGLIIELVFHKHSQTIQLGYGFESSSRLAMINRPSESTIYELMSRVGPTIIRGNHSFGSFLQRNGFPLVTPSEQQRQSEYRLSTYSTRAHADQRFNAILFSYPIERLRTHSLKSEALRIAKSIEQFIRTNQIQSNCSSALAIVNVTIVFILLTIFFNPLTR